MRELVVLSGKGGTGKTSVIAGLAALAVPVVVADCDVDAANLHLVLEPGPARPNPFPGGHLARIREEDCTGCGICESLCRFSAVEAVGENDGEVVYRVDPEHCEGCAVCVQFCPVGAIDFPERWCGEWSVADTRVGPLVHARLDPGAENSGKLVRVVRDRAHEVAEANGLPLVFSDGPPGIGCPATAALAGADLVLLVAEPSRSGLHDLGRVVELIRHFGVPAVACINRQDLSRSLSREVERHCTDWGVPVLARLPFDERVSEAQHLGLSIVEHAPGSEIARGLQSLWSRLRQRLVSPSAGAPILAGHDSPD